jgi:tRNA-2-methylthio-N6-dimethylallyladenosine synthase
MNQRDSDLVLGGLVSCGWRVCEDPQDADLILFNTCSVRQHAEDRALSVVGSLKRLKRERPEVVIGIIGCMAQNLKDELFKKLPHLDLVCGPNDLDKIPQLLWEITAKRIRGLAVDSQVRDNRFYENPSIASSGSVFVNVSEGCSSFCSYCVVPFLRGHQRSRRHQDVLKEVQGLVKRGIEEVTFLGQNVSAYDDGDVNLACLLRLASEIEGLKRVSFITSHPKDTRAELFYAMRDLDKVKKYLHLPVQSGSDRILSLMNRGYSQDYYIDLVKDYRRIVPDGVLSTDVIVGFPTETNEDFQDTFDLMKRIEFDSAYIFKYSPRPHTKATEYPDDVPKEVKEERHKILLDFQKELSLKKNYPGSGLECKAGS